MRTDLLTAFRSLRASPTFTFVALLVLALGIGASTAIFSVVDAVVLRGLPFDEHDRLVAVGSRRPPPPEYDPARDPAQLVTAAPQDFMDWDARQEVFEDLAASTVSSLTLAEPGAEPEDIRALRATADLFAVLRAQPALGRAFTVDNEADGRHRVAVISDGLWRRRFAADPAIVGRAIPIDGEPYRSISRSLHHLHPSLPRRLQRRPHPRGEIGRRLLHADQDVAVAHLRVVEVRQTASAAWR